MSDLPRLTNSRLTDVKNADVSELNSYLIGFCTFLPPFCVTGRASVGVLSGDDATPPNKRKKRKND